MKKESKIHNTYFLIIPTMHPFPLVGKMQKSETDADPPWGDGGWARKSLLKKDFIYYYWLQYQKTEISETSWSLYGMKPRSYNFPKF